MNTNKYIYYKLSVYLAKTLGYILAICYVIKHSIRHLSKIQNEIFRGAIVNLSQDYRYVINQYDVNHLKYNIDYLNNIDLKELINKSLEEQADFVDEIRKNWVDMDYPFRVDKLYDPSNFNATTIGNIAYTQLHHKSPATRSRAESILVKIKDRLDFIG